MVSNLKKKSLCHHSSGLIRLGQYVSENPLKVTLLASLTGRFVWFLINCFVVRKDEFTIVTLQANTARFHVYHTLSAFQQSLFWVLKMICNI